MPQTMKSVQPSRREGALVLTVHVDPLQVSRGARKLPRGGVHQSARRPTRAQTRRQLRRELTRAESL